MTQTDEEEGWILVTGSPPHRDPHPGLSGRPNWSDFGDPDTFYFVPPMPGFGSGEDGPVIIVEGQAEGEDDDEDQDEGPEIVVTAPSKGQEDFADDGDPFNDGEAPTKDTVLAWLEDAYARGLIVSYFIVDTENGYEGQYSVIPGLVNDFFLTDGFYGSFPQDPPPLPSPFEVASLQPGGHFEGPAYADLW